MITRDRVERPRPVNGHDKQERQRAIRELVRSRPLGSQRQVVDALIAQGFEVTQATVSRDIAEIGLVKAPSSDGPVYIVSNSGAKHYDLAAPDKNVWTNNGATQVLRGEKITTYQVVDVTADTLTYKSYIAEKVAGASTDLPVGAVYDEFTVTKRDDGTKWVTEAGVAVPSEPG